MKPYCDSIHQTKRFLTREVMVGNIGVGGNNPIRIQSMTTSNTRDAQATVDQIIKLADYGCEIARVTVQGIKEADACEEIKNTLIKKGYTIPVVADIHFFPPAAMRVVDFVDKVRINPGNFVDKRASFKVIEYDDASYAQELEKIEEKFTPLVLKCKQLKRSMRIGTNHGSLSDRIMNRYGDTPAGMVESAFEFTRVARKLDYHDIIFSMKASNPLVMIQAYRLLVAEMKKVNWDYPLHLGVTEAGLGEDGRVKSAVGIGALLLDGLGDTIRVSLTEDPWYEIDPCRRLVHFAEQYLNTGIEPFTETYRDFTEIKRRQVVLPKTIAMHRDGTVMVQVNDKDLARPDLYQALDCDGNGKPKIKPGTPDALVIAKAPKDQTKLEQLREYGLSILTPDMLPGAVNLISLAKAKQYLENQQRIERFTLKLATQSAQPVAVVISDESSVEWEGLKTLQPPLILFSPTKNRLHRGRQFFEWLQQNHLQIPVILNFSYSCSDEDLVIQSATEMGALLSDGLGEGVLIDAPCDLSLKRSLSFNILQAARMRTSKTEFISCPSCGRTLFDLQDVTKRIREKTAHLPGVKIAIMGCIVNGPGEMADADFGYVGSKPGKIDLYVGKTCVEKDIEFAYGDARLIELIKAHGKWQDPEE